MTKRLEVRAPSLGESEESATLVRWLVHEGEAVSEGDPIAEVESDKITMELPAPASGTIVRHLKKEGDEVRPGEVLAEMEEGEAPPRKEAARKAEKPKPSAEPEAPEEERHAPKVQAKKPPEPHPRPIPEPPRPEPAPAAPPEPATTGERVAMRVPITPIRRRIAKRLKQAQATAAMLTTFNEADMSAVLALKREFVQAFQERHGVKLGITSFFVYAACRALAKFPDLNAYWEDDAIVRHNYVDCGVAVATPQGLIVPVIRNAHALDLAGIERAIRELAERAREGTLTPEDLAGGTFSITNGGIFGSLLSTPILNPPQSAILGLHAIKERPVAVDGRVEIRPMMYLALTYDHRIVDGEQAVRFLVEVKRWIEHPGLAWLGL